MITPDKRFAGVVLGIALMSCGCQMNEAPSGRSDGRNVGASNSLSTKAARCKDSLDRQREARLELNLQEFDQNPSGGWRTLYNENCFVEAAELIDAYIEKYKLFNSTQLYFHAGQMFALNGDKASAVAKFRRSLLPPTVRSGSFLWNDYVLGTIAFLEGDKAALQSHLEALKAKQGVNVPNIRVLQLLLDRFELPYSEAIK
jgi:hypothetical protein